MTFMDNFSCRDLDGLTVVVDEHWATLSDLMNLIVSCFHLCSILEPLDAGHGVSLDVAVQVHRPADNHLRRRLISRLVDLRTG